MDISWVTYLLHKNRVLLYVCQKGTSHIIFKELAPSIITVYKIGSAAIANWFKMVLIVSLIQIRLVSLMGDILVKMFDSFMILCNTPKNMIHLDYYF